MTGPAVRRAPSLALERELLRRRGGVLAGIDEVGRGALAGPVTVGVVVIDLRTRSAPRGTRDSKDLSAPQRTALAPSIRRWAAASAVGHAQPDEIDTVGIVGALRVAAMRALGQLEMAIDTVLLDGSHDWLGTAGVAEDVPGQPRVVTAVKADRRCSSVAAASVLAKVERDQLMVALGQTDRRYGWADNKGYSAPGHLRALAVHGPTEQHRLSWELPGVAAVRAATISPQRARRRLETGDQLMVDITDSARTLPAGRSG